jgi:hypothetical protein
MVTSGTVIYGIPSQETHVQYKEQIGKFLVEIVFPKVADPLSFHPDPDPAL